MKIINFSGVDGVRAIANGMKWQVQHQWAEDNITRLTEWITLPELYASVEKAYDAASDKFEF